MRGGWSGVASKDGSGEVEANGSIVKVGGRERCGDARNRTKLLNSSRWQSIKLRRSCI